MSNAKRILIVEDDGDLRRLFCLALKLEGFGVVEAQDGYSALQRLELQHIDLVVLDLRLPGVDGFVVQKEIEARATLRRIPIVIVTAVTDDLSHLRGIRVLRKPVVPADLVAAIRTTLSADGAT